MQNIFTQEILRMLTIVGIGGISVMSVLGVYISKLHGSFAPYRKSTVIYLLLAMLALGVVGFVGMSYTFQNPGFTFIICQIIFLTLGFLHIRLMRKYLKWTDHKYAFWLELIFTIVVAAFGFIFFVILFKIMNKEGYEFFMGASVLLFIIAYFIYYTFMAAVNVPMKIYKQWYYPVHEEIEDPEESKLKNMLVISFEFQKKMTEKHFTNFRAKAPADMEFGQLFYYFINDYNERHPNGRIEFVDAQTEPYGWVFYKKPKWYTINTKYIDAGNTFFMNHVKENDVIICSRV
jgi:Type VI secretion system, TssN